MTTSAQRTTESAAARLRLARYLDRVEARLEHWLPPADQPPARMHQAMRYAVLAPGKRMRPLLAYAAAEALDLPAAAVDDTACAVELIHAYSLIHDDLPAMDDDDLRRGRPTCHRQYDEATAILAGDALQALAFECLAASPHNEAPPEARLAMLAALGRACGSHGMAGGQAIDLEAVGRQLGRHELEDMHRRKTGALIQAAVALPSLLTGDAGQREVLEGFGERIGLAFQIHDDVLDVAGATETLGKPRGSDEARGKPTFTSCLGLEASRDLAQSLLGEALALLDSLPGPTDLLRHLARFTVEREK